MPYYPSLMVSKEKFEIVKLHFSEKRWNQAAISHLANKPLQPFGKQTSLTGNGLFRIKIHFNETLVARCKTTILSIFSRKDLIYADRFIYLTYKTNNSVHETWFKSIF